MRHVWDRFAAALDEPALARAWRDAQPFPHVVLDDVIAPDELMAILDEESVDRYEGDLFVFDATPPEPAGSSFRALRDAFARALAPPLSRITGKRVATVDMRAFAYRVGHYLLPHSDHRDGLHRALAYAYYVPSPEPPAGGELELFRCAIDDGELVSIESVKLIEPRGHRLVVFDVSDVSLHQVREVVGGLRLSLAGWFYP